MSLPANKRNIIIAAVVAALLLLNFIIKPYIRNRDVVKVVTSVLEHWESGDLGLAMEYWEHEADSPPVYNLIGYTIEGSQVGKTDGRRSGEVTAMLEFAENKIFPTGRRWKFSLLKTRYGWKVVDFKMLNE